VPACRQSWVTLRRGALIRRKRMRTRGFDVHPRGTGARACAPRPPSPRCWGSFPWERCSYLRCRRSQLAVPRFLPAGPVLVPAVPTVPAHGTGARACGPKVSARGTGVRARGVDVTTRGRGHACPRHRRSNPRCQGPGRWVWCVHPRLPTLQRAVLPSAPVVPMCVPAGSGVRARGAGVRARRPRCSCPRC
jgi:hypothetical protein